MDRTTLRRAALVTLKALSSLIAAGLLIVWAYVGLLVDLLRCDDGCSGDQASSWQYSGQADLAVAGAAIGLIGLALGITTYRDIQLTLLGASVLSGLVWFVWVTGGF